MGTNRIKTSFITYVAFSVSLTIGCKEQTSEKATDNETQAIFPKGELEPAANFTPFRYTSDER